MTRPREPFRTYVDPRILDQSFTPEREERELDNPYAQVLFCIGFVAVLLGALIVIPG